jgi:hypothetical protein
MPDHNVTVIEKRPLSFGQIAVQLRCCADPTTDTWHTFGVTAETTPEGLAAWLEARKGEVAQLHEAHLAADAALQNLIV